MPNEVKKYHPEIDGPRPQCFSHEQWHYYVKHEKLICDNRPSGFCTDCSYRYKHKMLTEGKCRHPEVVFDEDENHEIVGFRLTKDLRDTK